METVIDERTSNQTDMDFLEALQSGSGIYLIVEDYETGSYFTTEIYNTGYFDGNVNESYINTEDREFESLYEVELYYEENSMRYWIYDDEYERDDYFEKIEESITFI